MSDHVNLEQLLVRAVERAAVEARDREWCDAFNLSHEATPVDAAEIINNTHECEKQSAGTVAYRRGQEAMRERAVAVVEQHMYAGRIRDQIRALTIEGAPQPGGDET